MSRIVIVGATSSIAEALVPLFLEKGHVIILAARSTSTIQHMFASLFETYKGMLEVVEADVTHEADLETLIRRYSTSDILINCAGTGYYTRSIEQADEKECETFQVNALAPCRLSKAFAKAYIRNGKGIIVNICSTASLTPQPFLNLYGSSKAFLFHYSLALAEEIREHYPHIRILTVNPGPIANTFFGKEVRKRFVLKEKHWFELTPQRVALEIVRGIRQKKTYLVVGKRNRLLAGVQRLLPVTMAARLNGRYLRKGVRDD